LVRRPGSRSSLAKLAWALRPTLPQLDLDPGRATFVRYDTRLQVSQDRAQAWKLKTKRL